MPSLKFRSKVKLRNCSTLILLNLSLKLSCRELLRDFRKLSAIFMNILTHFSLTLPLSARWLDSRFHKLKRSSLDTIDSSILRSNQTVFFRMKKIGAIKIKTCNFNVAISIMINQLRFQNFFSSAIANVSCIDSDTACFGNRSSYF